MDNFFKVTPKKRKVKIKSKQGVIYNNPSWGKKYLFYLGTIIIFLSIGGLGYIYQPVVKSWISYKKIDQKEVIKLVDEVEKEVKVIEDKKEETVEEEINDEEISDEEIIEQNDEFKITIPKIGANAEIIEGVSPYNKGEYIGILKDNVIAQSKISSLPGEGKGKTTYLFAHSSEQGMLAARQNSVFYLLGELNNDDAVLIYYKGNTYIYKVYTKKVIGAKESEYLNYVEKNKELLILQTCWPIGTNWQRLLVFAERI